jgi:hypothetical protein
MAEEQGSPKPSQAENQIPPQSPTSAAAPPPSVPQPAAPQPAYDEFSSARRNLPAIAPVAIAIVIVAIVVGLIAFVERPKPAASGTIDGVWFSQPANLPSPMILIELTLHNVSAKTIYIKDIKAAVTGDQGEQSDEAAAASDYDRYFQAYPDLRGHAPPFEDEMKIAPGAEQKGSVMVSLPLTQQQFDTRKDLTVTIQPYDQNAIVVHEKGGAGK